MEEILVYFALKYNGDFDLILKALEEKEYVEEEDKKRMLSKVKSKYTTIISEDYPDQLKEITCPPFVLFYYVSMYQADCFLYRSRSLYTVLQVQLQSTTLASY